MPNEKNVVHLDTVYDGKYLSDPKYNDSSGGNGGGEMSNYVTKEEFNSAIKDIKHAIELNHEKTNSSLSLLTQKVEHISDEIPNKIQLALNEKEKELIKEQKETKRYLVGTIILGILAIVAPILFELFFGN
ncbi:hypothetical protein [Enterococcus casseliflavus]|uniref:hypothetical protein n=1 Tax=Enterococcus casseliflavus TaxID=37734 RepID=UPI000FF88697|nr:hypothetical protein [Enterococcus casseliflavus]RXA69105.1 hypothetical protein EQ870_15690 [Enterococcus casseliflavus]